MPDAIHNRALVREALAQQRAQDADGDEPDATGDARKRTPSSGGGAQASPRKREAAWDEPDLPREAQSRAQPQAAAQPPEHSAAGAELQRLEALLAKVPDDPGSLLANRFAYQLRQRGAPHLDTGARW
jgi:Ca-activated chloride channel family protein